MEEEKIERVAAGLAKDLEEQVTFIKGTASLRWGGESVC